MSSSKRFADYFSEIEKDLNKVDILIAQNVGFDLRFIRNKFENCGNSLPSKEHFCTMRYFTNICKLPFKNKRCGGYKWPKLEELAKYFNTTDDDINIITKRLYKASNIRFHDARFDVVATYLCLSKAINKGLIKKFD